VNKISHNNVQKEVPWENASYNAYGMFYEIFQRRDARR